MGREREKLALLSFRDTAFTQPPPAKKLCRIPHADGLVEALFDSRHWSPCYGKVTDSRGCWTAMSLGMENTSGHSKHRCVKELLERSATNQNFEKHGTKSFHLFWPLISSFSPQFFIFCVTFQEGRSFSFNSPSFSPWVVEHMAHTQIVSPAVTQDSHFWDVTRSSHFYSPLCHWPLCWDC